MKEITLANNKGVVFVDDEDYNYLSNYKWYLSTFGYPQTSIYINKKRTSKQMHLFLINTPKDYVTDHIDRNPLNNQKENLRIVTISQNQMNISKRKKITTSKYKGVSLYKNKWQAQIQINKKPYHLGYYLNEIDAAKAYNKAAKELFGKYAKLNEE